MLIATFNETTGWSGKTIDFENDVFTLEGVGPLTAADVLSYDNQGYLEWANDGTRAWVQSKVEAPQVQGAATTSAPAESRLTSVWAKVTASAGAVSVAAGNAAQTAKVAYAGARDAMKEQRGGAPGQTEESTPVAESADEHTEAAAPAEPAEPPDSAPPQTAPVMPTVFVSQPNAISEGGAASTEAPETSDTDTMAEPAECSEGSMLVATFNETTGWAGKPITYESQQFILQGYGSVSAQTVMEYDASGQLDWATDVMRDWVVSLVPPPAASVASAASEPPGASANPPAGKGLFVKTVQFSRNANDVFDAIVAAAPKVGRTKVARSDPARGEVRVKVSPDAAQWGGEIKVLVSENGRGLSVASFTSKPRGLPGGFVAPAVAGQHRAILERLILAVEQELASKPPAGLVDGVIAVFGPDTELGGKKVTYDNGQLLVEEHGPISSSDLLEHDEQGHVVWRTDEMRRWVEARAAAEDDPRSNPEQSQYSRIPAVVLGVYIDHEGPRNVDAVLVGFCDQCLLFLAQSCIIVKPRLALDHPASFAEFPYADIESVIVHKDEAAPMVEVRTSSYQEPTQGPEVKDRQRRSNCFLGKMLRSKSLPLYVDRLRIRAGILEPPAGVSAIVRECTLIGGHGLSVAIGTAGDLFFGSDEVAFADQREGRAQWRVPYSTVQAIEVGGPGVTQTGGGFIGGGFGLEGAATGMLVGSALNLLTTRTKTDTVICLRTDAAEAFFHTSQVTPDAAQMGLSKVFGTLRQLNAARATPVVSPAPVAPDVVEQLAKLAELHSKGSITDAEFAAYKAKLMS